ncbi:MAG: DegV family protein [Ruminococcus sp.]|jgi:DegV family protein with EDD domain|nr:DegV family protein [Ruminococcus sp.]
MDKIKLITDSVSDILPETAAELDIEVLPVTLLLDGKSYLDGVDYTTEEFYRMLDNADEMPKTSQIPYLQFKEIYRKAYDDGYTDLIYSSLASIGSSTYSNALLAKKEFFEENPDVNFNIYVVDGGNYSLNYGYPVIEAAKMIKREKPINEIVDYLEDWSKSVEVYFAPFTLKFIRKSGRVSAAAAFAGELLGLRPIIGLVDAVSSVPFKVRGDKAAMEKLIDFCEKRRIPDTPYIILHGDNVETTEEFKKMVVKRFGTQPVMTQAIGSAIACHAGHNLVAIILKGERRNA